MSRAQIQIFDTSRAISRAVVLLVSLASLIFYHWIDATDMRWQVIVAVIALGLGIPHGALDHLISIPKSSLFKMAIFILIYVLVAAAAVWVLLTWSVVGFVGVVVMSSLHFGIGDAAFLAQQRGLKGERIPSVSTSFIYALAAGTLPVIIPLTNDKSTQALAEVNSELINWNGGLNTEIFRATLLIALIALLILLITGERDKAFDILLLALLALVAPPLVAFATYFGGWHALRHTARLTTHLKSAQNFIAHDRPARAFMQAVIPGVPALVGTFLVALFITQGSSESVSDTFLWYALVVVWALTVPHMMVTARLDKAALAE